MPSSIRQTLFKAVKRAVTPIVRLLMEHGVSHAELSELLKQVYIEVAEKEFKIEGKKVGSSHIAAVTGLHRREIPKVKKRMQQLGDDIEQPNPKTEIISLWRTEYSTAGQANTLTKEGVGSFAELVDRCFGDIPSVALLRDMERAGLIKNNESTVELIKENHTPERHTSERIGFLGRAYDLLETLRFNMTREHLETKYEQSASEIMVPESAMLELRSTLRHDANELLKKVDDFLQLNSKKDQERDPNEKLYRVGVSIFQFDEIMDKCDSEPE